MTPQKPLTRRQRTILEAILFLIGKGELPTVREVGSLVGLRSPATVIKHLRALERAELISVSGKSRGIRIANQQLLERVFEDRAGDLEAANGRPPPSDDAASRSRETHHRETHHRETHHRQTDDDRATLGDVLQAHLPGALHLTSPRSRSALGPAARGLPWRIPLVGSIAAGHPFESYSDGYTNDGFGFESCRSEDGHPGEPGFDDSGPGGFASGPASSTGTAGAPALDIDPRMFCESGDMLALKVEGDSMVNAGILDGDYAIIRRQRTVEEGEIAAVIINGEGTLKRWRTRSGAERARSVCLQPENDGFDPIEITEDEGRDVLIIGKYVGLVRGIRPVL